MYDMERTTTSRDFIRNFAHHKRAAANGADVLVRDRGGRIFVFQTKDGGPTLGRQLADLRGRFRTERPVKSLQGFGRNRP
jgi:hypothetical protein